MVIKKSRPLRRRIRVFITRGSCLLTVALADHICRGRGVCSPLTDDVANKNARGHDFRLVILLSNTASGWWIDKPVARSLWACRPYCDRSGRPYRAVSLPSRAAAGKGGRTPPSDPRPSQAPATFIYCYTYLLTLGFRPLFKFGFVFRVE